MEPYIFDAQLIGDDGIEVPVFCELQPPYVAGQKSQIRISVPVQHLTPIPPRSPCKLSGTCGALSISMEGIHWRTFPTSSLYTLGLEDIELLHVDRLIVKYASSSATHEMRFHLAPISFLRAKSSLNHLSSASHSVELFALELPGLGTTSFVMEWFTSYQRTAEIPGATISVGFSAVVRSPEHGWHDTSELVAQFKKTLDVLSVLFRQAVGLHGWTEFRGDVVTTWISPLNPNMSPSAREDRGKYIAPYHGFEEFAGSVAHSFHNAPKPIQSLVRHLALAVNPHVSLRDSEHFLLMFAAIERVIETAWRQEKASFSPTPTTEPLVKHLLELNRKILEADCEDALLLSERIKGLIGIVGRPSYRDKLHAFLRAFPAISRCGGDLWPLVGTDKERGLREIRNALSHGSSSFVSVNVVAVARWHLAIFVERVIFVLLNLPVPAAIAPNSSQLELDGRGWYEREWWGPLRSEQDSQM